MPALIETLIDKVDNLELVRDQIAAILVLESAQQQILAAAALPTPRNPALWKLRVFTERSDPWAHFSEDSPADTSPLVHVAIDTVSYDKSKSNTVERQHAVGIFNLDCYGYGKSSDKISGGHQPGDELAAFEAARAYRLVRNIILAGHYTYLGMRGVVGSRWPVSGNFDMSPQVDGRPMQHVRADRLSLEVYFNEFSPQVQGQPLELLSVLVKRDNGTGQVLVRSDYDYTT